MKKITLVVCLLMIAFVNAQDDENQSDKLTFEKGTQFVNLSLSLGTSDSNFISETQNFDTKRTHYNINSSYSYAISDNFFIGLGLGYSHVIQEQDDRSDQVDFESKNNTYRIFPYVRYYKGIGKKLAFFIQGETRFSFSKTELENEGDWRTKNLFIGVRPGLTLILNKNLALETSIGSLGYSSSDSKNNANAISNDYNSDSKGFGLSLNTSNLLFGVNYYF
ncbi:outer membrane beta-barrel protein [Kordia sp.]|uniref:outer membrane beta-barrel protein n=1 Tax=Kordia sp. TaxID=1965332 RepID=UPI003B58C74A